MNLKINVLVKIYILVDYVIKKKLISEDVFEFFMNCLKWYVYCYLNIYF